MTNIVASQTRRARHLLLAALRKPQELSGLPEADWELLVRLARRTRLLGRLDSDLSRLGLLDSVPHRAMNHLKASRNVIEHRKTLTTWEMNRILWALKGVDAPLILLKGIAYVMANLPPARGRIFADVDLLVSEQAIGNIEDRLVTRGWLKTSLHPYDDRYYRIWTHEIPPLRHRERGTEVDIHHRLVPRTSRLKFDPMPLFAAARPVADPRLRVLAPTDMVLHALVHLFLEGDPVEGLRLRDLVDVHDLLCHYGAEHGFWNALTSRAQALGLERPLFYGLRHTHRILSTSVPAEVIQKLQAAAPTWPLLKLMDQLIYDSILPEHPDYPSSRAVASRWLMYVRAHWLRMPPALLTRHLSYKTWLRIRGVPKYVDLAQLDLRQQ